MECICVMKDIYKAISSFEERFLGTFGLCINEAMVLCSLEEKQLSSSEIAEVAGLKFSHTSKVIRSLENKGYIIRAIGASDKRYMLFYLSNAGKAKVNEIQSQPLDIPELLQPVFHCKGIYV
jgi:DNA-binding MarR family transcriptional regulator